MSSSISGQSAACSHLIAPVVPQCLYTDRGNHRGTRLALLSSLPRVAELTCVTILCQAKVELQN